MEGMDHYDAKYSHIEIPSKWETRKANATQKRPPTGRPLSPMLFIIAIDPLQKILRKAIETTLISAVPTRCVHTAISMYADDAAIFIQPDQRELSALKDILTTFGEVTGMRINMDKTEVYPINCENMDLENIMQSFPAQLKSFPCQYLGLPLHKRKLRKIDIMPLIEKVAGKLPNWKGKHIAKAGRVQLAKSVLTSTVTHHAMVIPLTAWAINQIEKIVRDFIWKGDDAETKSSGHCLVRWEMVRRPKELGGLGVLDLQKFAKALRQRWLWQHWSEESKPWKGLPLPFNKGDRDFFAANTKFQVGSGETILFWHHTWLGNSPLKEQFPHLFSVATHKNKTVKEGITGKRWIRSVRGITTTEQIHEYITLWNMLTTIVLQQEEQDKARWIHTTNGEYSSKSAYLTQFANITRPFKTKHLWNVCLDSAA